MADTHNRKNHDYANEQDKFSNFHRAASITSWFSNPIDQVFAAIIGIKIARLAELLNGKEPLNESIRDNGLDLANYCALWEAERRERIDSKLQLVETGDSGGRIFHDPQNVSKYRV